MLTFAVAFSSCAAFLSDGSFLRMLLCSPFLKRFGIGLAVTYSSPAMDAQGRKQLKLSRQGPIGDSHAISKRTSNREGILPTFG
jgi:hypothetical protein